MYKQFIHMKIPELVFAVVFSTFLSTSVQAKESDFSKEIKIDARKQSMDMKNNVLTFNGDVVVIQGSLTIKAETLKVFSESADKDGNEIIIATGKPATYSQQLDNGKPISAKANQIRYEVTGRKLKLSGNSELNQNDSLVKGEVINYNLEKQELMAEGGSQDTGHVTTIFMPKDVKNRDKKDDKKETGEQNQ